MGNKTDGGAGSAFSGDHDNMTSLLASLSVLPFVALFCNLDKERVQDV